MTRSPLIPSNLENFPTFCAAGCLLLRDPSGKRFQEKGTRQIYDEGILVMVNVINLLVWLRAAEIMTSIDTGVGDAVLESRHVEADGDHLQEGSAPGGVLQESPQVRDG